MRAKKTKRMRYQLFIALAGLASLFAFQNGAPGFGVMDGSTLSSQNDGGGNLPADGELPRDAGVVNLKSLGGFRYQAGYRGIDVQDRLVCWGHKGLPQSEIVTNTFKVADTVASANSQCALTPEGKV